MYLYELKHLTFHEAVEKLKMETRRYAKRQLTWFRRNTEINWLNIDLNSFDELISKACAIVEKER